MRCCVQNCLNDDLKKTNKSNGITFHKLPKDPVHCSVWLRVLARKDCRLSKRLVVCSEHFLPEDFDYTRPNQRRVKSGAVPILMASDNQAELKVCRVCLALDVKMYDMKDFKLNVMFENVTGISACDKKESTLHRVCWECTARLTAAAAFRDKALLSDALLKDLVNIKNSDIAVFKQNHSFLKSPLTVQTVFTSSDIECEDTIFENQETEISLNDEADIKERKTELRIIEDEKEIEFEEYEPWIDVPMKTEIESDPIAENNINIKGRKNDTFLKLTHFNEVFTSREDSEEDAIRNNEVQMNNNDKVLSEDTKMTNVPIINDAGNIVLLDDKEKKLKLDVIVNIVDESSSEEDTQTTATELTVNKSKQKMSSKVGASNKRVRLNDRIKEKIIALKKNGLSVRAIAKETGLSIASVDRWWSRYRKNGNAYCRSTTVEAGLSDAKQDYCYNAAEPGKEMGDCSVIVRQRLHEAGFEHILMKKPERNVKMEQITSSPHRAPWRLTPRVSLNEALGQQRAFAHRIRSEFQFVFNLQSYSQPLTSLLIPLLSKHKALHDDLKQRIIALKQEGMTNSRIAYLLDTSRITVRKWWSRWCNEGHMQNGKQTGRKRKTTAEEDQLLIERVTQEQTVHTPSLAKELGISPECVRRRLAEAGFKHKERKAYVPLKSGRSHKVDEEIKQQIISLKLNGVSVTDIANQFRVPRTTIYQWWQRWCKENNIKITSDNNTSTATEQEQSLAEDTNVEKSLQTPTIISSQKSLWQKVPDVEIVP